MMKADRTNTLFIKVGIGGFLHQGAESEGYKMFSPYIEHNFFQRILREICFYVSILPKKKWYNKDIKVIPAKYILIWDTLITVDYLEWLHSQFTQAKICYLYDNMVGKAKHLMPTEIPPYIEKWTYDSYDSIKYGLKLYKTSFYFEKFVIKTGVKDIDVLFVGADKGRADYLLALESKMKLMGLKPYFVIVANGRFSKKKDFYKPYLPYHEVLKLISRSKAILNITMENQQGITLRDMESLFFNVKLITTNKYIVEQDFYKPDNVYILKELNIDNLPAFIDRPYSIIDEKIKLRHTFENFVNEITANGKQ